MVDKKVEVIVEDMAVLNAKIKAMEDAKRKPIVVPVDEIVSFDSWFHQRSPQIHKMHAKEIILADMKARGVKEMASMKDFDNALKLYGIELKAV